MPGAFQKVADHGAAPYAKGIVRAPREAVHHRSDEERGIGDAPGDDHLRAACQRRQQRLRAQISVGRDDRIVLAQRAAGFQCGLAQVERGKDVVSGHRGDAQAQAEPAGDLDDPPGGGERIRRAHVGDPHAVAHARRQEQLHSPLEQRVVSAVRIAAPPQLR